MLMSQVSPEESERIKKRFYIGEEDEYNCSSDPLNGLVFSMILDSMPSYASSRRKGLKQGYVADLVREGGISPCSLLLGMMYIRRLALTNQEYLATVSSRDLFLVAMLVASKFMNDEGELEALTNSEWSAVGCTPKMTVDQLERDFLKAIDWRLYVPVEEFYAFVGSVEGRVAMEQACKRGWTTYTELAAVWEDFDLQVSMLKHTAKVAFSGVTLYLVCVSTLMAALQTLALFGSDIGPAPLPLQQDSLQSPANGQAGNMPISHLPEVSTVADTPPPWKEVWPPNRTILHESPPALATRWHPYLTDHSAIHPGVPPGSNMDTHPSLSLVPPGDTPPGTLPGAPPDSATDMDTPPSLSPAPDVPPGPSIDTPLTSTYGALEPVDTRDLLGTGLEINARRFEHVTQGTVIASKSSLEEPLNLSITPPSLCVCVNKTRESLAKVEAPQAEDLSYHQKGTFHLDPFVNSSLFNASVTGALTFIVQHYLTPNWT